MQKTIFSLLVATSILFTPALSAQTKTEWQLSENGLGPMKIGMKVAEAEKAARKKFVLEPLTTPMVTEACRYATLKEGPKNVSLMLHNRVIVRIDVKNPKIHTTQGIHIGTAATEVKTLYKGKIEVRPNKYEADKETLVVTPNAKSANRLVFDTDGKNVAYMRAGKTPEVEYVEGCS